MYKFVLVEATRTHSGQPKPLHYEVSHLHSRHTDEKKTADALFYATHTLTATKLPVCSLSEIGSTLIHIKSGGNDPQPINPYHPSTWKKLNHIDTHQVEQIHILRYTEKNSTYIDIPIRTDKYDLHAKTELM